MTERQAAVKTDAAALRALADKMDLRRPVTWVGSEDAEFAERKKACKARRKVYGQDDCEDKDGSCDQCGHDMALALETDASKAARRKESRERTATLPLVRDVLRAIAFEREAATNTRVGLREAVAHVWVEHFAKARDTHMPAAKGAEAEWQLIQFLGCYLRLASNEPVQSAVDAARARAEEVHDRLRSVLYRILERHNAEPDVLALVGSLWDTLETPEVVGLMEDWLRDGETMRSPQ